MMGKKIVSIAMHLLLAVLGVLLFMNPLASMAIAIRVTGVAFLLAGVSAIVMYFFKDQRAGFDVFQCIGGGVFVVIALVLLTNPGFVISIFPILTGVIIAVYGVLSVGQTLTYKKIEAKGWEVSLALSIITICIGIIIFINPYRSAAIALRLVGAVMVYSGVSGCFFSATAKIHRIDEVE